MASTANPNIINTASVTQSSSIHSPGRRSSASRIMPSSPWTTIVRGESDAAAATATVTAVASPSSPLARSEPTVVVVATGAPEPVVLVASPSSSSMVADDESSDNGNGNGNGSNGNAGKRPVWNKPSNGVVEVGAVMGAVSWPALGESARASGKPSQDSLSKDVSSSISVPQGTGSVSSSSQKQVTHNANPNLTPNHTMPARQRSFKRNVGNSTSNGGVSQPTGSHPQQTGDMHSNNSSPRDHTTQRNSQSRNANDHPQQQQQQQRNSFRRNGGPHSRDASHHHNYGRRDQDRTNQDWNAHRSFNGRDAHMQPQRVVPRFLRHPPPPPPPPSTTPFIGPPPVRAFGSPIGFHELAPPMYYVAGPPPDPRAGHFVAPIPHVYFPAPDPQLHSKIVKQIDYYFSNENLIKDTFLRQNMDKQGFVPVKLIAGFNKVSHLTDNIQLILDSIRSSTVVEVQGDKVRRRNDWDKWMMPSASQFPNVPGAPSVVRPNHDVLIAGVQNMSLEENANLQSATRSQADVHNDAFLGRASSGDLNSQSQVSSAEGVSDSSNLAQNLSK
ncbi:La-related protein 1C [Euphorbia peplus]|nr:La-related protein 1C [Euphorbia peplus]